MVSYFNFFEEVSEMMLCLWFIVESMNAQANKQLAEAETATKAYQSRVVEVLQKLLMQLVRSPSTVYLRYTGRERTV